MYQERRLTKSVTIDGTKYEVEFLGDGFRVMHAGVSQVSGWVWESGRIGNVTLYARDFRLIDKLIQTAEVEARKLAT